MHLLQSAVEASKIISYWSNSLRNVFSFHRLIRTYMYMYSRCIKYYCYKLFITRSCSQSNATFMPVFVIFRETGVVYLPGHLHTLGGAAPNMYARHKTGFLELEVGDWMDNRLYVEYPTCYTYQCEYHDIPNSIALPNRCAPLFGNKHNNNNCAFFKRQAYLSS